MIPGWHAAVDVTLSLLAKGGRRAVVAFGGQEGPGLVSHAVASLARALPRDAAGYAGGNTVLPGRASRREARHRTALSRRYAVCRRRGEGLMDVDRDRIVL